MKTVFGAAQHVLYYDVRAVNTSQFGSSTVGQTLSPTEKQQTEFCFAGHAHNERLRSLAGRVELDRDLRGVRRILRRVRHRCQ